MRAPPAQRSLAAPWPTQPWLGPRRCRSLATPTRRRQVLDTVQEIQERHSAVRELERQLLGLHQIFLDMAVLVEAQGEMLDNIETQVAKANEYVNQGNKALTSAKELQKDTRKWMCCAMALLLSICLIVVLAVVKPWKVRRRGLGGSVGVPVCVADAGACVVRADGRAVRCAVLAPRCRAAAAAQ